MKINQIYQKYSTPPGLQNHQYRVAAVANFLANKLRLTEKEVKYITLYGLLHDMGNIVKADYLNPLCPEDWEERERWQVIAEMYRKKYGNSAHDATVKIISELGASKVDIEFFENSAFGKTDGVPFTEIWRIGKYADLRVDPFGIVSLEKRLDEIKSRYAENAVTLEKTAREEEQAIDFENKLTSLGIQPLEINDSSCEPIIKILSEFEIDW